MTKKQSPGKLRTACAWLQKTVHFVVAFLWREIEFRDVLIYPGLLCICYGVAQIYLPAGWIVLGLGLWGMGYFGTFQWLLQEWMKFALVKRNKDAS